jgi:hypothetical protein
MKQSIHTFILIAIFMAIAGIKINAQEPANLLSRIMNSPDRLLEEVNKKTEKISDRLSTESGKYLLRMAREERRLRRKLARTDSLAAERIFGESETKYETLHQQLNNTSETSLSQQQSYLPHLDSLQTAIKFLDETKGMTDGSAGANAALKETIGKMNQLQNKFSQADKIKEYLAERRQFLQDRLAAFGLRKELTKLKQQVYYYQATLQSYKQALNDPTQLEARVMGILQKTTVFENFFRNHSQLAGMFRLPETTTANPVASFAGLQTRDGVQQQLVQRFGNLPDVQQMASQQVNEAQSQINQLKDKITKSASGNGESEMPDFKPNNQKTKSLLKRLEFGTNLQTVKSNYFFPSTSDIALSVGYKLNDKSVIGVGGSYKMGWGKDARHVTITSQGIGLRSFLDIKIKGNFWLSGGAEMNYRNQFDNFEVLRNYTPWQKSALLGLSKKYKVNKRIKGNIQLLYDFLNKQQIPRTQPIIFRTGYTL